MPVPPHVTIVCPWNTVHWSKKKQIEQQSFSLSLLRRPPLSRPLRRRFGRGKAFLPLCHSDPRRTPRVKPGAHRYPRSPAQRCRWSGGVRLLRIVQHGLKNKHGLNVSLQSRSTLVYSYILGLLVQMEAKQSPFMLHFVPQGTHNA